MANLTLAERKRALTALVTKINKKAGDQIIVDSANIPVIDAISTGSPKVDALLGINGVAKGRLTELYGEEGSGKSTFCYMLAANAQKTYPEELVVYIDVEQACSLEYCAKLGVDLDPSRFLLVQPDSGAQALQIMEDFVESGLCSLVILDSIAALITEQELNGEAGDQFMAVLPRLLGAPIKRLTTLAKRANTACVFINQTRSTMALHGSPTTTPGGKVLKFQASTRIEVKRIEYLKDSKDIPFGAKLRIRLIKSRFSPPHTMTECNLIFGVGIDQVIESVDVAVDKKIIVQGGAWFKVPVQGKDLIQFQGKEKVYDYFRSDSDALAYLNSLLFTKKTTITEVVDPADLEETDEE